MVELGGDEGKVGWMRLSWRTQMEREGRTDFQRGLYGT